MKARWFTRAGLAQRAASGRPPGRGDSSVSVSASPGMTPRIFQRAGRSMSGITDR